MKLGEAMEKHSCDTQWIGDEKLRRETRRNSKVMLWQSSEVQSESYEMSGTALESLGVETQGNCIEMNCIGKTRNGYAVAKQ